MSIDMLLRALKLAHEVSYEKVGAHIEARTGIKRSIEIYRRWILRVGKFIVEQEKNPLRAHNDQVMDVKFSQDGKLLYSAGLDKTWKVWKVEALKRKL